MRLSVSVLLSLSFMLASGCYAPSIPDGTQLCSADQKCADGMSCFPDNHCYKTGSTPGCATPCTGLTPQCDPTTLKCVGCVVDTDCAAGNVCLADVKVCGCTSDAVCAKGGTATPRCDLSNSKCQPCLPTNDNCAAGTYCDGAPGNYTCKTGCKSKSDCTASATADCCAHACVDTSSDGMNCGACANACTMGSACCGSACTDTTMSLGNCGGCGMSCAPANVVTATCSASMCGYDVCAVGFSDCDMNVVNGCEQNITNDPNHCGGCAAACPTPTNATAGCANSRCGIGMCNPGYGDCDMKSGNGCEALLYSDANNCGTCGTVCALPNTTPTCTLGVCTAANCSAGYLDCDMVVANGCEVNKLTDGMNCGACGTTCNLLNAAPSCSAGMCNTAKCNAGFTDCNKIANDGCEVNTGKDIKNCGACGTVCNLANVVAQTCTAGKCVVGTCNTNYADCDQMAANGCESNSQTDAKNCGMCGTVCAFANATPTCVAGKCAMGACLPNYADCDKMAGNGCEVNTQTDGSNCGSCGTVCALGSICTNSVCTHGSVKAVLIHAEGTVAFATDVQTKLLMTGAFATVDLFNGMSATPTVAQMEAYDVALVWTDSAFTDPVTMGNNLATYWNAGGRVVVATFANCFGLTGNFGTVGNGYILIAPGGQAGVSDSLGMVNEPMSALMAGVNTFATTAGYHSAGAVANGGIVVAAWKSSGAPLVVRGVVNGRNRVDLNFFPPSSAARMDFWTGDGATLLKNALLYK